MEISTDICIIGSGLAAYAAAVELQGSGLEITVVAKAPGASALSSGAWDAAEPPLRIAGDPWQRLIPIAAGVEEILRRDAFHPYSIFSVNAPRGNFSDYLLRLMERAAQALPLSFFYRPGHNLILPVDLGNLKATAFVQASMADADLAAMERAKILVVGINGYPQCNPRFIRASLVEAQASQTPLHVELAGHLAVDLEPHPNKASLSGIECAQALDQEEVCRAFARGVVQYLDSKIYTHLLLPPVMGLENTSAILDTLRKASGLKVAEILATPMSVPGWRMQSAIEKYFAKEGITLLAGEVVGYDSEGSRVRSLRVHELENRIRLNAKGFILATGKYIGGGIRRDGLYREACFHLPVTRHGNMLGGASVARRSNSDAAAIQDFLAAGVAVNRRAQPVDLAGQAIFENLFAAGAVLADFDPAHERCAAGVSILSGTLAARHLRESI